MTATALLLAAGTGRRLGATVPKAFVPLSGRPMLLFGLQAMEASGVIDRVVVVVPPTLVGEARAIVRNSGSSSIVQDVVEGGASRAESVRRGLVMVSPAVDVVVCHDAARPLASPELFRRAVDALGDADGVVPVIRSADTVKRLKEDRVVETIPRHTVGLAQTPQVFRAGCLRSAHETARPDASIEVTDDAMLLEAAGFRVVAVEGEANNLKITTAEDLRGAEAFLRSGSGHSWRPAEEQGHAVRRSR